MKNQYSLSQAGALRALKRWSSTTNRGYAGLLAAMKEENVSRSLISDVPFYMTEVDDLRSLAYSCIRLIQSYESKVGGFKRSLSELLDFDFEEVKE